MPYTLTELHGRRAGLTPNNRIGLLNRMFDVTITPAQGGSSNVCLVTIQLVDHEGNNVAAVRNLMVMLSDDATSGAGLTTTTASGNVVAGTAGVDLGDLTSKKAKMVQTDSTGKYILSITDTGKTAFVVVVHMHDHITLKALAAGNYK